MLRGGSFEVPVNLPLNFQCWNVVDERERTMFHLPPYKGLSQDDYVLDNIRCLSMINGALFSKPLSIDHTCMKLLSIEMNISYQWCFPGESS